MKISRIRLQGFRGALSPLEIPLGNGFTVICGRNGSGKSTICDAIEYVLTGTLARFEEDTERSEGIRDYIWWRGEPKAAAHFVALDFIDDDGKPFALIRTGTDPINSGSASLLFDAGLAPADPLIQLALTSIIRDETITRFSVDSSERERYEFVIRGVGLASSTAFEEKSATVSRHLKDQREQSELRYQSQREQVGQLTTLLSQAQTAAAQATGRNLDAILAQYADSPAQPGSLPTALKNLATNLARRRTRFEALTGLLREKQSLDSQMDLAQSQQQLSLTASLASRVNALESQFAAVQAQHQTSLEQLTILQGKSPEISSLAALVEHGGRVGLRDQRCPLCGSRISAGAFSRHLREVNDEVRRINDELVNATQREAQARLEKERIARELDLAKREHQTALRLTEDLQSRLSAIEQTAKELGVTPVKQDILEAIERDRREISKLNEHLAIIEAFSSLQMVEDLQRRLSEAQQTSRQLERDVQRLSAAEHRASEASRAAKRVSAEILDERLAALRPLFSELYERLRPHTEWSEADFHMRGDVRRFLSLEVGDNLNPKFIFSSGQRRALGLAFLLSVHLARRWCKLETLVLDDPVQHVDDFRALHLAEALASLRMIDRQILCTVEDPALAGLLGRRLRSRPGSEGTRIDLEYVRGVGIQVQRTQIVSSVPSRVLMTA